MTDLTTIADTTGAADASAPDRPGERISFAQEQIWIAEQLAPDRSVYGVPMVIRLRGALDTVLAQSCVTEIVRRQEVLRSRVAERDGELFLITDPPRSFPLSVLDLRARPGEWHRLVEAAACEPFDLVHGPLLRVTVLRLADDEHVLFLNVHHLVADGWSLRLFWAEFAALYTAWHGGTEPDLPGLTAQYRDFATEQRQTAEAGGYRQALEEWLRDLAGAPTNLELPADHRPRARQDRQGSELRIEVPERIRDAAFACARRLRATPFAVLGAVWAVALARYTRQDDLLIGTPLVGRSRPEFEPLIGLFVNTMPLRLRPSADKPFAELVRELQLSTFDALSRQDAPFTELAKLVRTERTAREAPLFQTVYSFEQSVQFEAALPDCAVTELYELSNGAARFSLSLGAVDALGRLSLQFAYDSRLFDPGTVEGLAESFLALLEQAASRSELPIGSLRTSTDCAPDPALAGRPVGAGRDTLHALFEQQVRRRPDAAAVECEDGTRISYGELNGRANRLARLLRGRGLHTGERVAIGLPRGSSWAAAVLAVLKAGGAYVPISPDAPADRNAHVLAETAPRFLLTVAGLAAAFEGAGQVLLLDDAAISRALETQSGEDLEDTGATSRQVAYLPFTSGSTGVPKGTLVTHANLTAFTRAAVQAFALGPTERMLQIAAMTFDVHVEEFFPTWQAGGCVVFFSGELARTTPEGLLKLLREREITVCELPTAYWIELVRTTDPATVPLPRHMRRLLIGGERAPIAIYQSWLDFGIPLTNVYGLTETAVTSTTFQPAVGFDREALAIGRPMPHAAVYVLDGVLAPVGQGVPGEIYLGGPGVGDGLLNRPAQTAERFVPDPYAGEPGARMYRTGDYGRWTAEGDLEFLGRVDRQLKLRGHRVELAEIEAVLDGHPGAVRSVVVPRRTVLEGVENLELEAFVMSTEVEAAQITAFARTSLPPHMIPARISVVETFPLTPHGKIDQTALLALEAPEAVLPDQAQVSELESRVAEVYREVLGAPVADLRADLFALGFHSLTALRLVSRLRSRFALEISVAEFFADSSITAAARLIAVAGTGASTC
jgi:amino acid adenylation domain-containing protein